MSDWDQSIGARYADAKTGRIVLAPDKVRGLKRHVHVSGELDLGMAKTALEEELMNLLRPTWSETLLSVFKTAGALREAARAPVGESRLVKLAGSELPLSAPFELCVTWSGTRLPAVKGELTVTLEFAVSVKVRDGSICEIAPFAWSATPSIEIADEELWKGDPLDHELGAPYVLSPPLALG